MELSGFADLLSAKCAPRSGAFSPSDDFFPDAVLAHVETTWAQWLGPLVVELPRFETVLADLRPRIGAALR